MGVGGSDSSEAQLAGSGKAENFRFQQLADGPGSAPAVSANDRFC